MGEEFTIGLNHRLGARDVTTKVVEAAVVAGVLDAGFVVHSRAHVGTTKSGLGAILICGAFSDGVLTTVVASIVALTVSPHVLIRSIRIAGVLLFDGTEEG